MKELPNFQLGDLKTMSEEELKNLSSIIRANIIDTISETGGHLSSNLGIVELTIALHKVFNSPHDKIIFDVSHQTFAHKLLTGRSIDENNFRKYQGISGFTKKNESEHDIYEAGHSSTSISAAIGLAEAREIDPTIGDIIAVIGDASITNGLSFEALNYLGSQKNRKIIIIINDNEMSVSRNVGTLARAFNKIRVNHKHHITPKLLGNFGMRIKGSIKSFIYPRNTIFSAMNFRYFEGIDGHDFNQLCYYLKFAKESTSSVILHVKTIKGKGYNFAENDIEGIWHSAPAFDKTTGIQKVCKGLLVGDYLAHHLMKKVVNDEKIRVISPAMLLGTGLKAFSTAYPEKTLDVGIAEENAVVIASSMVQNGLTPIVFMYSTFLQRAYDEVLHDVARTGSPVVFCIDRSGIVAGDGDTHQGIYDIGFLSTIPGITISMPSCIEEAIRILDLGLSKKHGPLEIRYPKSLLSNSLSKPFKFGEWEILNELHRVNIITYGPDVYEIYERLIKEKLDQKIGLVNARFIKPYDKRCLSRIVSDSEKIIVYEQVIKEGSLGSSIKEYLFDNKYNGEYVAFSLNEGYLEVGTVKEIKRKNGLDIDKLFREIKK